MKNPGMRMAPQPGSKIDMSVLNARSCTPAAPARPSQNHCAPRIVPPQRPLPEAVEGAHR
jgi:hypothetical protein